MAILKTAAIYSLIIITVLFLLFLLARDIYSFFRKIKNR